MIINATLANALFRAFFIHRWNDNITPLELVEMDKHAHKMIIAWCIGKYEESRGVEVNWQNLIKGGVYELLRRIIISDIKSPILYKIKHDYKEAFDKLNKWVFAQLEGTVEHTFLRAELEQYLLGDGLIDEYSQKLLSAAHVYASYWEFRIIKHANPIVLQNERTEKEFLKDLDGYLEFIGMRKLMSRQTVADFVDLCGQLRFQNRWLQIPRLFKTSVLGHQMLVACFSYLFALDNNASPKRIYNDFFGGLFHDLPEVLTRDIISPVKRSSEEFEKIIKDIERDLAEREILPLIEESWRNELRYYIFDEFKNKVYIENKLIDSGISIENINQEYNHDDFNPMDGETIRAADHLAAFLEAYNSVYYGVRSEEFSNAMKQIRLNYTDRKMGNIDLTDIYSELSSHLESLG
jgi:putative hydrolase of HD superfamily